MQTHPERDAIREANLERMRHGEGAGDYIKHAWDGFAPPAPGGNLFEQQRERVLRGFWARRLIDGSAGEIHRNLVQLSEALGDAAPPGRSAPRPAVFDDG